MLSEKKILGILCLQLTGVGTLANFYILFLYSFHFLNSNKIKPINQILIHLAISNILLLVFRGIPNIAELWGMTCFLDGTGTIILTFLQVLPRGISLLIPCQLSIFQAITLTPNTSKWAELKTRAPKYISPCILLAWIFNMLINLVGFVFFSGPWNSTERKYGCNLGYRSMDLYNRNHLKISLAIFFHDAVFICLMACSSGYMLFILYRHNKQLKYLHGTSLTPKTSPEIRATKTILLLVGNFIFFNAASPIFILYVYNFQVKSLWVIHIPSLLALCYPTVSAFILITTDTLINKACWTH